MPSLIRLLTVCAVFATLVLGSLYVLANYFEPEQKEVTKPIRNLTPKS